MDLLYCNSCRTHKAPEIFGDKKTCSECLIRVKEIYEALTNVEDIDENLESNHKFYFEQAISLDTLISEIPLDVEKDKYEHYIANKIAMLNKETELVSKRQKHSDISKQRNTEFDMLRRSSLIAINLANNYANIKLSHRQLHQRPRYNSVSEEVKQYISENLVFKTSELHREIISKKLDGFK
ncbi:11133_t:CDS:2, partial [Gigaspora rosea]